MSPDCPDVGGEVLVVAFGNDLMGDDGVGPEVLRILRARGAPSGVRLEDGDSDALRIPSLWRGEREVWLVDAVAANGFPGAIHDLGHEVVLSVPQRHASAHRLSVPESLRWIMLARPEMKKVRYRLWGVEVAKVRPVQGLTPEVEEACGRVADAIVTAMAERLSQA